MSKMPLVYNDPQHWHARAAETRIMAARMLDPEVRERMLAVAVKFDKIAGRAVERLKAVAMGRRPLVNDAEG
jgi:hypothetical protein